MTQKEPPCEHRNITFFEQFLSENVFYFENGKPPEDGYREIEGDPTPWRLTAICQDCGKEAYPHLDREHGICTACPQWVRDAWDAILAEQHKIPTIRRTSG